MGLLRILFALILLASPVWADSENLLFDADVTTGWSCNGLPCPTGNYATINNSSDVNRVYVDNTDGDIDMYRVANSGVGEGTIDSVQFIIRDSVTHASNAISIRDSIPGVAIRETAIAVSVGSWGADTVTYTTAPDAGAWTWTDVDNLLAGLNNVNTQPSNQSHVSRLIVNIWYTITSNRRKKLISEGQ